MDTGAVSCINKKRLIHYDAHRYYVNNHKRKVEKNLQARTRKEFIEILTAFYTIIGEQMIEREAGVCIKELGYFFIWKIPKKLQWSFLNKNGYENKFNYHTNHVMYSPIFVPAQKMKYWYMDKAFAKPIKKALKNKLLEGKKYKMYPHTLRQLKKYHI